ncbi:MAG: VCBS repeat-containing protein [Desulfatibacillum sp.]|nr:VCBS repeat-containing protein [Desulfatibacillum sp.]
MVALPRIDLNNGTADPFAGVIGKEIAAQGRMVLGDVDGDGDLDIVTNYGQTNRLYLNNGTTAPFNGVTGTDISADTKYTNAIALVDVDGDGDLDLVAGNNVQASRLYLNNGIPNTQKLGTGSDINQVKRETRSKDTSVSSMDLNGPYLCQSRGVSLEVDTGVENIELAGFEAATTLPPNTRVDFWLSNNGGAKWFLAKPGTPFAFPTTGSDLRWKAELHSLSPALTPRVEQVELFNIIPGDMNIDALVNMEDLLQALIIMTGKDSGRRASLQNEVNDDGKISVEEAIFIMQKISSDS